MATGEPGPQVRRFSAFSLNSDGLQTLPADHQTSLADHQTPLTGLQTPPAYPQSSELPSNFSNFPSYPFDRQSDPSDLSQDGRTDGRTDGRMDGRTDGQTDGKSPHSKGLRPLSGPLPKKRKLERDCHIDEQVKGEMGRFFSNHIPMCPKTSAARTMILPNDRMIE